MALTRSLSNKDGKKSTVSLVVQNKIDGYLERKYRISRSHATRDSYRRIVNRFVKFIQIQKNQRFEEFEATLQDSDSDPIGILDEYYSYLSGGDRPLSSNSIRIYLVIAKDFLNYLGCRIYIEDIKQRFRIPKMRHTYEEGFTKETINRIIRFSNPKLATVILMLCSSGMRISELLQLRLQDIDFEKRPVTVRNHIPDLNKKNENGRNSIHFHAFQAWFKTQVTDAHQSDFAEALMGHKSLKLVYYRQNEKARAQTYLDVEHALTIADIEKINENFTQIQKENLELRGIVDSLSKQLQTIEKRIKIIP